MSSVPAPFFTSRVVAFVSVISRTATVPSATVTSGAADKKRSSP